MNRKQGDAHHPPIRSRFSKRTQELEERVAGQAKELRRIREMLGTRTGTGEELLSLVGKPVKIVDVAGEAYRGILVSVSKWTLNIAIPPDVQGSHYNTIFMKGNIISINMDSVACANG